MRALRLFAALVVSTCACHGGSSRHASLRDAGSSERRDAGADSSTRDAASEPRDASSDRRDAAAQTRDAASADASFPGSPRDAAASAADVKLPPSSGKLDYQLGGAYTPPQGVQVVSRDRTASIAPGLYNICYVNGFQAQPEEDDFWLEQHPTLVLRDRGGKPVIDSDWNEMLLDVSTADKRSGLLEVEGAWIDGCADAGFDAVEIDNLDSYSRSGGALKESDAVEFLALLSKRAHQRGLAIAQKNSSELVSRRQELGTDFAVAEECSRYDECDVYVGAYGQNVLMIEYRRADFSAGCARYPNYPIVLRDLNLTTPDSKAYVFEDC